ncbi:uncharacterized protein LOC113357182 [Papaver somniferum]|uniref:uncharacterized protein LOC113357182 n=1 Tax=Papaver somniferum TaxID=3469 RepID=UPI000E705C7E|nr:uncharacterized protein LOC113357182 [Papaver somniferum]
MSQNIIHNSLDDSKGNIWLFWNCSITPPEVIATSKQCITVEVGGVLFTGIHDTVNRRELRQDLCDISLLNKPWLILGDFNSVLSVDEKKRVRTKRILCNLDRAFFNLKWLETFNGWHYKVGSRGISDHGPIIGSNTVIPRALNTPFRFQRMWLSHPSFMQVIIDSWSEEISSNPIYIFMNKLKRLKKILKAWNWEVFGDVKANLAKAEEKIRESIFDVVPQVITYEDNSLLDGLLDENEIKSAIFDLNQDSAPGPDGFTGIFYRAAWDTIKKDLVESIHYCWKNNIIPIGMNSNFLVLIPKIKGAKCAKNFRPISLSNFCFKIITKIITMRLTTMLHKVISPQQSAFVKNRNIHDQILLASELVNEMTTKRRGGNLALKLDISQAYDTMSLEFLYRAMKKFGFSAMFCKWILVLLKSSKISIMLNEGPIGFFGVGRGLKQGDPLSPIHFIIAEDILSRNIHYMILKKKIQPMIVRNGMHPSHLLFADDILLFYNGGMRNITNLRALLVEYQAATGQVINTAKSKLFINGTSDSRKRQIVDFLQMDLSTFPDRYLGVMLVQGRVKSCHLWHIVDYMHNRFAAWSEKFLNFQARLTLVKHVLCSIPIYNMSIYKWLRKIIDACERIIRNYLWSRNVEDQKCVTLKWENVCTSKEEGGLGIRNLEYLNKPFLMKFLWRMKKSNEECDKFFLYKYTDKNGNWITYYKKSSVWPGIRWVIKEFDENTRWIVGTGEKISLWNDSWIYEEPIIKLFPNHPFIASYPFLKFNTLIVNGQWCIPADFLQFFNHHQLLILDEGDDILVWCNSHSGCFTVSEAMKKISSPKPKLYWYKKIWADVVPPSTAANIWKITREVCPSEENLEKRKKEDFNLLQDVYSATMRKTP